MYKNVLTINVKNALFGLLQMVAFISKHVFHEVMVMLEYRYMFNFSEIKKYNGPDPVVFNYFRFRFSRRSRGGRGRGKGGGGLQYLCKKEVGGGESWKLIKILNWIKK